MSYTIIGSREACRIWPYYRDTSKSDVDIAFSSQKAMDDYIGSRGKPLLTEYHVIPPLFEIQDVKKEDMLYTLKVSHSFWMRENFEKTMWDIEFMKSHGAKINEDLYKRLYKHWETIHGKKDISLNMSNMDFFDDKLKRTMDHDDLHRWMAYGDKPVYEKLKKDNSKALIDKDMFFNLSKEEQLNCCREEIAVIALEKWVIPSNMKMDGKLAWKRSYKHLVTVITKGWFARYLVENYEYLKNPDYEYKKKFQIKCRSEGFGEYGSDAPAEEVEKSK